MRHPVNRSGHYQVLYRIAKLPNLQKTASSQVFSVNIVEIFRVDYLQNTSVRLLLQQLTNKAFEE